MAEDQNQLTPIVNAETAPAAIREEIAAEVQAHGTRPPQPFGERGTAMKPAKPEHDPALASSVSRSLWYYSWKRLKRNKLAIVGLAVTLLLIVIAILANFLAPFDPNQQVLEYATKESGFKGNILLRKSEVNPDLAVPIPIAEYHVEGDQVVYITDDGTQKKIEISKLQGKTESEWHQTPRYVFGTDRYGRDVLSRLMYGARVSLTVAFFSELLSIVIGIVLGAIAGFYRGWIDDVIMWMTNVVWSIPSMLLIIAISIALGLGLWQTIFAIGVTGWVDMTRIVRGQFFALRETEYVEATRALGLSNMRAIFRHILPNSVGPIIVIATAGFASAIVYEASLSFLGLGVQPPTATWGQMINDGFGFIAAGTNWGLTIYPALAIMVAVFAFNLFGDGLRDALDPKLKR